MKKIISLLAFYLWAVLLPAQSLNFTATLVDSDSITWANATCSIQLYNPAVPVSYYNGTVVPNQPACTVNSSGVLSATLYTTSTITPGAAQYTFNICSLSSAPCSSFNTPITTASGSSQLSALLTPVRVSANTAHAYAYSDNQLTSPQIGNMYYNTISNTFRYYNGTAWTAIGGGSGGATLPSSGIVCATSTTTGVACTSGQLAAVLGPYASTVNGASGAVTITPANIGAVAFNAIPTASLLADYRLQDGSGTTIADSSGNGNTGTLMSGANAPTFIPGGLQFAANQGVSLPPALNAAKTFYTAIFIQPPFVNNGGGLYPNFSYPTYLSSSLGTAGYNLLLGYTAGGVIYGNLYAFAPSVYNSATTSSAGALIAGFHVLALVAGTGSGNVDHWYMDGKEFQSYVVQNSSAGAQTSGNLYLGSSNASPWQGFNGNLYRFVFYSNQHTAAQVASTSAAILADVVSRGVTTTPATQQLRATPQLMGIGDSITYGFLASTNWMSNLTLVNQPSYTIDNYGFVGLPLLSLIGSEPWRYASQCKSAAATPSTAIVFMGTNDFSIQGPPNAQTVMGYLGIEIKTLKAAGCRVYAATMLSRGGNDYASRTYDADKDAYDALILSQAKGYGADGVIDFAANPLLGADGANANATYFNGDTTHPTNAGQILMGAAASNSLNYYNGYSAANPRTYTATATLASGDGFVIAKPTAATALTMPDCTGPSGESYVIQNAQATYAVTVTGGTNQPINGLTTAITIPANATVTLRDVANPKTVSGCGWSL